MTTLILAAVCGGVYPSAVWGIALLAFPDQAHGSLIIAGDGTVRGSMLIGQGFASDRYFHPRPSSAGVRGYDAANSGGSNLGPTSRKLHDAVKARIGEYRRRNALEETQPVPADAVTASGSGLDPHISPRNAELQSARVATVRKVDREVVRRLIRTHTDGAGWGFLGKPGVNVLRLNLALDQL